VHPKPITARRRKISFDGRTVTLRIATKVWGIAPDNTDHHFRVETLTVRHKNATAWHLGEVVFESSDAPTEIVTNVPLFADKLPGNVFCYEYPKRAKVKEFLEAVDEACKKARKK
jgi:hypothetical protein